MVVLTTLSSQPGVSHGSAHNIVESLGVSNTRLKGLIAALKSFNLG